MPRSVDPITAHIEVLALASLNTETGPTFTGLRRGRPDDGWLEDSVGRDIRREHVIWKVRVNPTVAK